MTHATGTAERDATVTMVEDLAGSHRITLDADKAYDTARCAECQRLAVGDRKTATAGQRWSGGFLT